MESKLPPDNNNRIEELKHAFLTSAIGDISTYIQLTDTKVSIIMGALVALIAGACSCYEPIARILSRIKPCSWLGILIIIFILLHLLSIISVFIFGLLTIRGHVSNIGYNSKWFLTKSTKEYSFDAYKKEINMMTEKDIVENMAAELYKLNDIYRQKSQTNKWTLRCFASALFTATIVGLLLLISIL